MQKNCKSLTRYYRTVRSWLPVSWRQKNQIIADLRGSIHTYLDAHPEAGLQEIQTHFGTPASIAAAYVDNTDTTSLLRDLRIRKRIVTAVVSGVLAIVLTVTATLALELTDHFNTMDGFVKEMITDNGATEIIP